MINRDKKNKKSYIFECKFLSQDSTDGHLKRKLKRGLKQIIKNKYYEIVAEIDSDQEEDLIDEDLEQIKFEGEVEQDENQG